MASGLSKEILFTYFSGHATALQKQLIKEWLADGENYEMYYECLEDWERSQPHYLPDIDRSWVKNAERMHQTNSSETHYQKHTATWLYGFSIGLKNWLSWKVAATVLLGGLSCYWFGDQVFYKQYETSYGELHTVNLEDNSMVVLNANSKLRVPRWGFGTRHRDVFLDGEAQFSVTKMDDLKKFTVHTRGSNQVTALGTEFVVYTRERGTRVVLNEGKVRMLTNDPDKPSLDMIPGDQVSISPQGKVNLEKLTKTEMDSRASWKEHRLVFDRTPLSEVGAILNENFGVNIKIADSTLSQRALTGTFRAQNLEDFLKVLAVMLDIDVEMRSQTIYLRPTHQVGDH